MGARERIGQPGAALVLRAVVGVVMAAHGLDKVATGLPAFTGLVRSLGVPAPEVVAVVVIAAEALGGLALVLGLLTRWAALGNAAVLGGLLIALRPAPRIVGGPELELVLLAALVALALAGPGSWSLDAVLARHRPLPHPASRALGAVAPTT